MWRHRDNKHIYCQGVKSQGEIVEKLLSFIIEKKKENLECLPLISGRD